MKVIIIGLGSMGKRRIRLMKKLNSKIEIIGVDSREDRCKEVEKVQKIKTFLSLNEAMEYGADCAFVCTSPLSHADLISFCLENGLHVFTEINLVADKYEENMLLAKKKNLKLFLSSTFLYRDELRYINKKVLQTTSSVSYMYHVGQYLPDWHPWENIKDFFVDNRRTNGCREILAIELPWIQKVFGKIQEVKVWKQKLTELDIDYSDSYHIIIKHEDGIVGQLAVDVVSRKPVRNLEIYGEDLYLSWNGSPDGLFEFDIEEKKYGNIVLYDSVEQLDGYSSFIIENAYLNEIKTFFECLNEDNNPVYGFEDDLITINWIDKIEE